MTRRPTTATVQVAPVAGQTDLVIAPTGSGRGRLSFDRTLASPLLLAIGSERRAATDDVLPPMMAPNGPAPFGARRGWVGDVLLSDGQRQGSRLWLLERAKRTEATRLSAEDYTAEAISAIADYHDLELNVSASWQRIPGEGLRGVLVVQVEGDGISVTRQVTA